MLDVSQVFTILTSLKQLKVLDIHNSELETGFKNLTDQILLRKKEEELIG